MSKAVLMQGNEAVVEGAIAAGARFFAGYPITPSTEIAEQSALRLPQVGGTFIQMEDELASVAAVLGASAAGVKSFTATSGPGFSLMQENIGYGAMAEIPCVIVDVQRAGPSTGLATSPSQGDYMQARWGTHGDHPVIALSPSSVLEAYRLTVRAFNLSEKYRTPVILLMDEIVGHMREGVTLPNPNELIINSRKMSFHDGANKQCYYVPEGQYVPAMKPFGRGERYNITGLAHDISGFPTNDNAVAGAGIKRLLDKVEKNADDIIRTEEYLLDDAETAIVCFGGTKRAAMDAIAALRARGEKVGLFRPVTLWPFPKKEIAEAAKKVKKILTVEMSMGQMVQDVQINAGKYCDVDFLGRPGGMLPEVEKIVQRVKSYV